MSHLLSSKPTSLWQPLGYTSDHAPHCHTSWPSARIIMSRAPTRSPNMSMKAKSELIKRFREHFAQELVINILQDTDGMPAIKHDRSQKQMRLSIGFHPANYSEMQRAVAVFQESHELSSCHKWACFFFFATSAHESELLGRTRCQPRKQLSTKRALMSTFLT